METSFLDLRCKEVVNVVDGKRLGHIVDIVFDFGNGCMLGVVVPGDKSFWGILKKDNDIFIALSQIIKIGEDTVLVELYATNVSTYALGKSNTSKKIKQQ